MIKQHIILLEDDEEATFFTQSFLEDCGFKVTSFNLAIDSISSMKLIKYDMLLLDLNLPDADGFEVLKSIKNSVLIPTIVISAYSDIQTKLHAFKLGALDYIEKPYNLEELEARIWACLSKSNGVDNNRYIFEIRDENIIFNNEKLKLTQIESEILKTLIKNKNIAISREKLSKSLSSISSQRSLDYHIKNIRTKINDDGSNSRYLKTEYGVGYILEF